MATGTQALAAWVFAGLTALPLQAGAAQEQKLLSDVRESFAGFAWGATSDQIAAARGRPARDTTIRDFRHLTYRDSSSGQPVGVRYLLHPTRGLMAGQLEFDKRSDACQDRFKEIRRGLEHANPGLKKKNERKVRLEVVCDGAMGAQLGLWALAWGDSGSARVSEMMMTGAPDILVYYRGPVADSYVVAQQASRGPSIASFASFAWGSPREAIVKRLGPPKNIDSTSGAVTLSYNDLLLGQRAVVEFTTAPIEGLIKGVYWVPVPAGQDCDLFYRKFYFALVERFPDITPTVSRFGSNKNFCQNIAKGTASLTAFWSDPKAGAVVTAELHKPGKYVRISYTGSNYLAWSKRTRASDLKGKL